MATYSVWLTDEESAELQKNSVMEKQRTNL